MAITTPEVVKANLVLVGLHLLGAPGEVEAFKRVVGSEVQLAATGLIANLQSGTADPGRALILNRERIALELSQSRSTISREYPSRGDLRGLAKVAWQAIVNTSSAESKPRTFGFNIDLVFDQGSGTPAFGYLSSRLFDVGLLGDKDWQLIGGAGSLIFDDGGRRWTFKLEPRFNDANESKVFLSVNLHMGNHPLPDEEGIGTSLEEVWKKVHDFVQRLDEKEDHNG